MFARRLRRITSYNVCYTKLLRVDALADAVDHLHRIVEELGVVDVDEGSLAQALPRRASAFHHAARPGEPLASDLAGVDAVAEEAARMGQHAAERWDAARGIAVRVHDARVRKGGEQAVEMLEVERGLPEPALPAASTRSLV